MEKTGDIVEVGDVFGLYISRGNVSECNFC